MKNGIWNHLLFFFTVLFFTKIQGGENQIRRSKFNVDKTKKGKQNRTIKDYLTGETITFDSLLELKYYKEVVVKGLQDGSIQFCSRQFKYVLIPSFKYNGTTIREIAYIADFVIEYSDGRKQTVDIKGLADNVAKLKRKLFYKIYPDIDYIWLSHTVATGWIEYDQLQKIRKSKKKADQNN